MDFLVYVDQFLVWLMQKLKQLHLLIINKIGYSVPDNPNKYEALIPNESSDKDGQYSQALLYALKTLKVNNIAISGAYGSGKSSFLRTFEKKNDVDWHYLHISLATFKDPISSDTAKEGQSSKREGKTTDIKAEKVTQEEQQLIEKSILQQIFYKECDKTIPYSRFKRIKNLKKSFLILHVVAIAFFLSYTFAIYFPTEISVFLQVSSSDFTSTLNEYKKWFLLIALPIGLYYFYQFIKYLSNLKISKFNLKNGEMEVANKDKASILNEHLDEILYFFQVTQFNVVVIEDLDRFDNTEIFIKLRELNTLLNNSKDVGRRIIFIYAIKDDMFIDNKDRTKFFDFILPIIPYINSTSSFQKMKEKFKDEKISDDFLRDIALYIDEMRLLINIHNEYKLYKNKIGNSEYFSAEKLLAMIIYKNFYPKDFALLHKGEGSLYTIFSKRFSWISSLSNDVAQNKQKKNDEIAKRKEVLAQERQKTVEELRMVYLFRIYRRVNSTQFYTNANRYFNLSDADNQTKDVMFEEIMNVERINNHFSFSDIEKEINNTHSYREREKLILEMSDEKLEFLKKELEALSAEEHKIKKYFIRDLSKTTISNEIFSVIEKESLLKYLIREGYIDEDYHWYISHFFEGSLTYKDREFVLAVKDGKILPVDFELTNKKEIVLHLKESEFNSKAILNYSLVEYCVQKREENFLKDKFDSLFKKLADESEESREFVLSFVLVTVESAFFVKKIATLWKNLWFYIANESNVTQEKKEEYFKLLFQYLSVKELVTLNIDQSLKLYLQNNEKLEKYTESDNEKFQSLIESLNVKYGYIENPTDNPPLFHFIYEKNLYAFNEKIINQVAYVKGKPEREFSEALKTAHLTTLKTTYASKLIDYIAQNINEYIENVFLKIETNTQESEDVVIELFNNEDVKKENKIKIIQKEVVKIQDISKVNNKEILEYILEANKVVPKWDNLLYYYQEVNELNKTLIDFFNKEENYSELSKSKMNNEATFTKELLQKFSKEILLANEISDKAYEFIVRGIWFWKYKVLEFQTLSSKKVGILLENTKLELTQANINNLREYFTDKVVILLEYFKSDLLAKIDEFELQSGDYLHILNSQKFTDTEKILLIEKADVSIFESKELMLCTNNLYIKNSKLIPMDLFEVLFEKSTLQESLKILTLQIPNLEFEKISDYLDQFDSPYSDLSQKGAKPIEFEPNNVNKALIKTLEDKKYISTSSLKKNKIIVNRKRS
ncbi:hypothetical protein [Sulfurospirillum sp. MES]|uniref:YobI family P-loop NTPase n=1 Tax=Sulfurospirillum sp. MES TaxID=1565314 RepID=UPI000542267E|nr:hypothetical protein [Sulfurospirillum sp. MES]KHG34326.1 MAG: hypothetical protein OA34_04260 [Sulfurospirillum sp. MES]